MKSNLLKVFCGIALAMFMQTNVEGMQQKPTKNNDSNANISDQLKEADDNSEASEEEAEAEEEEEEEGIIKIQWSELVEINKKQEERASTMNTAINGLSTIGGSCEGELSDVRYLMFCILCHPKEGNRLINLTVQEVENLIKALSEFVKNHEDIARVYPVVFGKQPGSLIHLLKNCYDKDKGILSVSNESREIIHNEYSEMRDDGIYWDFTLYKYNMSSCKFSTQSEEH